MFPRKAVANLASLSNRLGHPCPRQARDQIAEHKLHLLSHENRVKQQNLKTWRERLLSSTAEVGRWLRAKENFPVQCVLDREGRRTSSVVEAAQAIHDYWRLFWRDLDNSRPPLQQRVEALLSAVQDPEESVTFPLPTGEEIFQRARKSTGSGGADGWSGAELKHLPVQVFECFASLASQWVQAGCVPQQVLQARMICVPKQTKIKDHCIAVEHMRPLTVVAVCALPVPRFPKLGERHFGL